MSNAARTLSFPRGFKCSVGVQLRGNVLGSSSENPESRSKAAPPLETRRPRLERRECGLRGLILRQEGNTRETHPWVHRGHGTYFRVSL